MTLRLRAPDSADARLFLALLLLISAAGFAARIAPFAWRGAAIEYDSARYLELAKGMVTGCGYARRVGGACAAPEVLRTPGYPAFLVACRNIGASVAVVSMLGAIVILAVGCLIGSRWSHRAGLLAALLLAVDLSSISLSSAVMTDALFQSVLAAAVLLELFAVWSDRPRIAALLTGALLLGVAALVRPLAVFLWPFAWLAALAAPLPTRRTRATVVIAAAVLAIAPVLAWSARNERAANSFSLSTDGPITMYYSVGGGILSTADHTSVAQQYQRLEAAANVAHSEDTPATLNGFMMRRAVRIAVEHPAAALKFELFSFLRMALAPDDAWVRGLVRAGPPPYVGEPYFMHAGARARDILGHPSLLLLLALQLCWLAVVWVGSGRVFVALAAGEVPHRARNAVAILLGVTGTLIVLCAASAAPSGRMRVSFAPMLAMLAAMGWLRPQSSDIATRSA
jgi:4-amino-4-deoxy-L-arabinose transferase-like glycosyltransferase